MRLASPLTRAPPPSPRLAYFHRSRSSSILYGQEEVHSSSSYSSSSSRRRSSSSNRRGSSSSSRRSSSREGIVTLACANNGVQIGVFPGGTRRASVRLPGLGFKLRTEEVMARSSSLRMVLDSAVSAGLTLVVLEDGKEESLQLYEAARAVMSILKGRADLLVVERVDIAAAANANGVVLSDQGLPSVVARRMMQNAMPEATVLPLVARRVSTLQSAENATVAEGADLLMLEVSDPSEAAALSERLAKRVKIPIFLETSQASPSVELIKAGASGLLLSCLPEPAEVSTYVTALLSLVRSSLQPGDRKIPAARSGISTSFLGQQQQAEAVIREEQVVLLSAADVIREAAPEMSELSLLKDTVKQLTELFLLVVVGEFNSGKSSVVNALLGGDFMKQGILPTTNEITLLKFADEGFEARAERHPDGHLMRYLSAQLLKQMNLVDTPGTNVILQRQQRLTEEFVPRADLVMFVISVERPLTESEVSFLRYIRKWDKKIIFVLNKIDFLSNSQEMEEVRKFVADNVRQLLNIEDPVVYPVSARKALAAKQNAGSSSADIPVDVLRQDPLWKGSRFDDLEQYILGFLGGSSEAGAERIRLKLETPLGIAAALLSACLQQLEQDYLEVEENKKILGKMQQRRLRFEDSMVNSAKKQSDRVLKEVNEASKQLLLHLDDILQITNLNTASKYLLPRRSANTDIALVNKQIMSPAFSAVRRVIEDHRVWLASSIEKQLESYQDLARRRWPAFGEDEQAVGVIEIPTKSMDVLEGFDVPAATLLLEQEVRDVVFNTFGSIGVAGASASFLTSVLPTTLEDTIALALCSAGGLTSAFKLSSLKEDVKRKVERVASSFVQRMQEAMQAEVEECVAAVGESLGLLTQPYSMQVDAEAARVASLRGRLEEVDKQVKALKQKVHNL